MHSNILLNKDLGFKHALEALHIGEMYRDSVSIGVSHIQQNNLQKQNKSRRLI